MLIYLHFVVYNFTKFNATVAKMLKSCFLLFQRDLTRFVISTQSETLNVSFSTVLKPFLMTKCHAHYFDDTAHMDMVMS